MRARAELGADAKLAALERDLASRGARVERLAVKSGLRTDGVPTASVTSLVSKGHYTYLYANGREYLSELSLIHFEERLDPDRFLRLHRSALVNVEHVAFPLRLTRCRSSPPRDDGSRR